MQNVGNWYLLHQNTEQLFFCYILMIDYFFICIVREAVVKNWSVLFGFC